MALILLAAYAACILCAGLSPGRRGAEAFFVNNRSAGAMSVGFSILVSCVGASATLGMIGMAFTLGTPAFWWLGAGAAGLVALALLLARKVRQSGAYTLPHLAESLLGKRARPVISLLIVIAWTAILAAQFSALCRVLEPLTGFAPLVCLGIGLVLVCGHTFGGQSAIMRVDRFQALIILACLGAILAWLTWQNPDWTATVSLEAANNDFPPSRVCYFLLIVGANYVVCPMLFGRLLSARDERSAALGGLLGAGGIALCACLIVAVGLACKGLVPPNTPEDAVLPAVLEAAMPGWMQIVVSFALISAIVSSADSCLVTAATVLSFDLLGRKKAASGQRCVLALGLAGAFVSLWGKGVLGFLLMAYDIFACGVVMPVFLALLLQNKRRPDERFACAAVVLGGLLGAASALTGDTLYSYAGLCASLTLSAAGFLRGGIPALPARRGVVSR